FISGMYYHTPIQWCSLTKKIIPVLQNHSIEEKWAPLNSSSSSPQCTYMTSSTTTWRCWARYTTSPRTVYFIRIYSQIENIQVLNRNIEVQTKYKHEEPTVEIPGHA
ncbi:hypothetical protein SARC_15682, partial [Sphaeroforma arctica JP610]